MAQALSASRAERGSELHSSECGMCVAACDLRAHVAADCPSVPAPTLPQPP